MLTLINLKTNPLLVDARPLTNDDLIGQHTDIEIPYGSSNQVIVPDTVKITFNLDIELTDKTRSVVSNVGRALIKKLKLGSTDIDTTDNSDVYHTYKDLYLSEKEREERLLQGIQSLNGLKARVGANKADATALTITTHENAIKKTFDKSFSIQLDFNFLSILCIYMDLKQTIFLLGLN